jgi:hypothetical protein
MEEPNVWLQAEVYRPVDNFNGAGRCPKGENQRRAGRQKSDVIHQKMNHGGQAGDRLQQR